MAQMLPQQKPKILVVGSFVMDLIVSTPRFPNAGETVLGSNFTTAPGGKGANQAVQAARLGADVTMLGKVGEDDFGRQMIQSIMAAGVSAQHVLQTKEVSSAIGNVQLEVKEHSSQNRIIRWCIGTAARQREIEEYIYADNGLYSSSDPRIAILMRSWRSDTDCGWQLSAGQQEWRCAKDILGLKRGNSNCSASFGGN